MSVGCCIIMGRAQLVHPAEGVEFELFLYKPGARHSCKSPQCFCFAGCRRSSHFDTDRVLSGHVSPLETATGLLQQQIGDI